MLDGEGSEAHQPLIAREEDDHYYGDSDETQAGHGRASHAAGRAALTGGGGEGGGGGGGGGDVDEGSTRVLWLLTLSAGLSGLLFGYDTGVISSTLISLHESLSRPLTTWDKSAIASSTSLLALAASPLAGFFADTFGRRPVIASATCLFIAGALVQAFAASVWVMVAGRAIVGAAVGLASAIVPMYIAEIAPAEKRGRLVTVQSLFITGGQVVAYLVGWAAQGRWRWAVGLGAVPAVLQAGLLVGMPESPRWLIMKGQEEKAEKILRSLSGKSATDAVLQRVREEAEEEGALMGKRTWDSSIRDLFQVPGHRRALTIACMLQGLQQLCGFNSLMYFSATIFSLVGFTSPIGTSLSIALTNFIFTVFAFKLIDKVGRRRILLYSMPLMALGLAACAVSFFFLNAGAKHETDASTPFTAAAAATGSIWPYLLLASLILYVSAYAIGLGCVPWQQSELFPLTVRSLGSGMATATNWSGNFVVGVSFLPMMQTLGATTTFVCYTTICVLGWCLIWAIYPETSGLALEDVGRLLATGWGVRPEKGRRAQEDSQS
ncbi:hypothetical protein MBLNU459_g6139t1 [Dothideomycetes sp. NU459]